MFTKPTIRKEDTSMASSISKESLRFIFVGLVNTIHHYLWYLFFTEWLSVPYIISHWLAFVISMIGSFYMNTYFTYRTKTIMAKISPVSSNLYCQYSSFHYCPLHPERMGFYEQPSCANISISIRNSFHFYNFQKSSYS